LAGLATRKLSKGQARSDIFGLDLGLENLPQKSQMFQFFPFGSKKISLGCVKKYPGQRWIGLVFTVGQKYFGSGPTATYFCSRKRKVNVMD